MNRITPTHGMMIHRDTDWRPELARAALRRADRRFEAPRDHWTTAIVTNVVDGDTVDLSVQLPCMQHALIHRARLVGINAPETHTRNADEKRAGIASADFLRSMVNDRCVVVHITGADMYGRLLVDLWCAQDDEHAPAPWWCSPCCVPAVALHLDDMSHINDRMIQHGHAVAYDGKGRREPWKLIS